MKKIIALLLACLMVAGMFAGCGSSEKPAETQTAAAENAAPAAGVIKVGTSGPLTNDYAVYGVAVKNGLELAFEEINALGGLQFETRAEDDEADGEMAVNAYNTLMDWGMQIMAGPTTSGSAAAAAAECAADGVFMLTPSASDASVITAATMSSRSASPTPTRASAPLTSSLPTTWPPRLPSSSTTPTPTPWASTTSSRSRPLWWAWRSWLRKPSTTTTRLTC